MTMREAEERISVLMALVFAQNELLRFHNLQPESSTDPTENVAAMLKNLATTVAAHAEKR